MKQVIKLEFKTEYDCHPDNAIPFAVEELLELLQDFRETDPSAGKRLTWTVESAKKPK